MKCRTCGKQITPKQIKDYTAIKVTYNERNVYFCSEMHCKEYFDKEKLTKYNVEMLDKIDKFIKSEIIYFNKMPILPRYLFTKINDLFNGTTRTGNRQIKNGTSGGYPYEVILLAFEKSKENINYSFKTKLASAKESQKVNYMMAIVEGNINDTYITWLGCREQERANRENETLTFYSDNEVNIQKHKKENNNLLEFITEEDL